MTSEVKEKKGRILFYGSSGSTSLFRCIHSHYKINTVPGQPKNEFTLEEKYSIRTAKELAELLLFFQSGDYLSAAGKSAGRKLAINKFSV